MTNLQQVRKHLQDNGFRWDAFINGSAVQVEVIDGSQVLTYLCRNMKQAQWVINKYQPQG